MKRAALSAVPRLPLLLLLLGLTAGCVSKKEHEAVTAKLGTCEDEKAALQAENVNWERRFDRESQRWEELGASVTDALPKALVEFHQERDRILELVPQQVQSEVQDYLEDYFETVSKGFQLLKNDNEEIKAQLAATGTALAAVGADTKSISATVDRSLADERRRRDKVSQELAALLDKVVDFDRTRIDCAKCPDKLGLSRKERETILAFHDELTRSLSEIQSLIGGAPPEGEAAADAAAEPGR
jgi:hypothetical protein